MAMKAEDKIHLLAWRFADDAASDRRDYSSICAGRAVGATIGALCAVAIGAWAAPPTLAAAFLFATLVVGGRIVGGWATVRRLGNASRFSSDHVEMLARALRAIGVPDGENGRWVRCLIRNHLDPRVLRDPEILLQLLPEGAFQPVRPEPTPQVATPGLASEPVSPSQIDGDSDGHSKLSVATQPLQRMGLPQGTRVESSGQPDGDPRR
jgi:hypothetical protein